MCFHFDYTMGIIDIDVRDILLDEKKKNENILIYDISYKTTFMSSIPLRISFDKIDGLLKSMIN